MMPVSLAMPGNERLADDLAALLPAERVPATVRHFPDGESHVRVEGLVQGREAFIVCTLNRPDAKLVPLLLLACALRDAGARRVGLVAPYLAYMRQDRRFQHGETVSALHVAAWISRHVDWLVTVDPHLHRIKELSQVYSVPTRVVHAAGAVAAWIKEQVPEPLLIGPDEESAQWVGDIAQRLGAPHIVLSKTRRGDREVEVSAPGLNLAMARDPAHDPAREATRDPAHWRGHAPVLVDDIVSSASTMIEAVGLLRRADLAAPVCVAVHALFAQSAFEDLRAAGAADIVSCDSIGHPSNRIKLAPDIAQGVRALLD